MSLNTHQISLQDAAELTANYRELPLGQLGQLLTNVKGAMFSNDALQAVMDQPGCKSVRFYFAVKSNIPPIFTLVAVGVDANGNDMVNGILLDHAHMCPPDCSVTNSLNH
jgi:hypothetical protein